MATDQKPAQVASEHRLHISGLTPQISPADLKERFQRFGDVQKVDAVGPDALGQPRNFVYLTINAKQQDLTKCINSMQNSIWRGAKLKIAPAKKSYEERLATERLSEAEIKATLNEKEARKLRIKERKDRKRRLARAGGGRQSGDMRVMTVENWKNEGDLWRGKYWRLTPSQHLIRPIFTRPTHPLHMKPVSKASDSFEPVIKTTKVDPYEALGTLGKKAKKPRCLPPKRAMRMLLDPFRYGQMHLSGAVLDGPGSEPPAVPEGTWEFAYDDVQFDDIGSRINPSLISGRWIHHPANDTSGFTESTEGDNEAGEVVQGKRKRVAEQLQQIAASSVFPDTLNDIDSQPSKKSKATSSGDRKTEGGFSEGSRRFTLDDDDLPALDDDDIWGAAPPAIEQGAVSLFDSVPAPVATRKGPLKAVIVPAEEKPASKTAAVVNAEDLSDVDFEDEDALFDNGEGNAVDQPSSPLFHDETVVANPSDSPESVASQDEFEEDADHVASTGVGMSLKTFARSEKQKGLSVLQSLGIDLGNHTEASLETEAVKEVTFSDDEQEGQAKALATKTVDPSMAWLYDDDEDEDVLDFPSAVPRLRGGGDGSKDKSDSDDSDSESESDSDSEEDDSSSSSGEEDDASKADLNGGAQEKKGGKQSLKDMFAAQPEPTGFSLMAGLDLELDSDLEMDEANPFQAPAPVPQDEIEVSTFAPVPTVDANAVFNASSSTEPFFFGTTGRPLAQTEDLQEGWMSKITVGGMEKEEVEVQPFWKTETDEQMSQLWNEQKRELTQEYKKRHREAVKRQKRGMGGAGSSAANGGMDVD